MLRSIVTYGPENLTVLQKEEGFTQAMEARGLVPQIVRTGSAANAMQAGMDGVALLLERGELPTALWCASDYMAIGAMNALRLRGLSVPGDVSVMGHDDLYFDLYPDIGLTTLHTPMTELGKAAIELAVTLMEQGEPPQLRRSFQPDLVVRESTGPLRRPG